MKTEYMRHKISISLRECLHNLISDDCFKTCSSRLYPITQNKTYIHMVLFSDMHEHYSKTQFLMLCFFFFLIKGKT